MRRRRRTEYRSQESGARITEPPASDGLVRLWRIVRSALLPHADLLHSPSLRASHGAWRVDCTEHLQKDLVEPNTHIRDSGTSWSVGAGGFPGDLRLLGFRN